MTASILYALLGILVTFIGQAVRNWWLKHKETRLLQKTLKSTLEVQKELNEVQNRPMADGRKLASRFRLRKD